jgi:hypothetical protein
MGTAPMIRIHQGCLSNRHVDKKSLTVNHYYSEVAAVSRYVHETRKRERNKHGRKGRGKLTQTVSSPFCSSYLSIIRSSGSEEGMKRIVARDKETGKVNQELARNVEKDEEEVDANKAEEGVDLRDGGLSFQVVEDRVLGELDFMS